MGDILSLIGSVLSQPPSNSSTSHSLQHQNNLLSPMNGQNNYNMNQLNAMSSHLNSIQTSLNQQQPQRRLSNLPPLNQLLNKRKQPTEETAIHPNAKQAMEHFPGMLNNYGNIVNNNYQILKNQLNANKEKSPSPFVPPLVDAVCGAVGCYKTKRDDGSQLLMCGRCFLIKYCSKECQLAHIHEHRKNCKRKSVR